MKGLALSEAYYRQIAEPLWQQLIPEYMPEMAIGLAGEGSECLGYDDDWSQDHDFGPGFCIWMPMTSYGKYGEKIMSLYQELPDSFCGFRGRKESEQGRGRVGVIPIEEFYERYTGCPAGPENIRQWFAIPEHFLAKATNGRVFTDPLGEFSRIRRGLMNYYPEEVRWKKMASRAHTMAQSGQYNYLRSVKRRDTGAAFLALREFVYAACSMMHLLHKKYMPYYKWSFRSLRDIEPAREAVKLLEPMLLSPFDPGNGDRIEQICRMVREEWNQQELTDSKDDFLEVQAWELYGRITDEYLRTRHISEG